MHECGEEDPVPQVVNEAPLTNGHTHLVNGALKPEDLSSDTDELSVDKDLPKYRVKSSVDKPQTPPVQSQTKPDPYEFPHSPLKQSEPPPVCVEQSSPQVGNEQRPKPPPPTYQEAIKATGNHLLKHFQPSCHVNSKTSPSPASCSILNSPVRLNGCHRSAFSSDPASPNSANVTARPGCPAETSSLSSPTKTSAQLLAQTGGLISEFYSRSRLHQISTWRNGFSEYVNELNSKRKAAGATSFPGKDRLRKFVAQRSGDGRGKYRRITLLLCTIKSTVLSPREGSTFTLNNKFNFFFQNAKNVAFVNVNKQKNANEALK